MGGVGCAGGGVGSAEWVVLVEEMMWTVYLAQWWRLGRVVVVFSLGMVVVGTVWGQRWGWWAWL